MQCFLIHTNQYEESIMKISIALASYNGAQYIQAQLQSFVEQTHQPDELIITDDCSTDETDAIIRNFSKTAPFTVKFYRNERNLGYCGNFNAALMKTTGDLVFLSDQDDVWFPDKIEHMLSVAKANPEALVVMNDAALTNGELNEVGLTKIGQIRSAGFPMRYFVMGCCCGVRRELLDFCLPIPAGLKSHDNWLVLMADELGCKLIDNRILQYYRRHESNESQFIANRTVKVTKLQALIHSIKKARHPDSHKAGLDQLNQLQVFSDGVSEVLAKAPESYRHAIEATLTRCKADTHRLQQSIEIRRMGLISRIAATLYFAITGGYRNTSSLKAILRDLLG